MDTAKKMEAMTNKILGQFESTYQAFDLEEILSLYTNEQDRMLCWNAAMNLVEQGRVHVIQVAEKENPSHVRWILVGFEHEILSNDKFVPPGPVFDTNLMKASEAVKFKKAWKKSSSLEEVANELATTIENVKRWATQFRKLGFNFNELPERALVAPITVEEVCATMAPMTPDECVEASMSR